MFDSKEIYDYIIKIQSIAKIGLVCSKDAYALTDYQRINELSMEMLEKFLEVKFDRPNYFSRDVYPTPNISVRTIIFNQDKSKFIMVREVNSHQYSLPGGWCDLYDSAGETSINECRQEAGAEVEIVRLVGLTNRLPFKQNTSLPEYVAIFEAKLKGELHEHEYETDDVGWFSLDNLPELSRKVSMVEFTRMVNAAIKGETIFD